MGETTKPTDAQMALADYIVATVVNAFGSQLLGTDDDLRRWAAAQRAVAAVLVEEFPEVPRA